jgi:hypothetical protein
MVKNLHLEQVQDAANKSNLSLEEYLAKSGMTRILESSPDFQNPTMPGAVVGEFKHPIWGPDWQMVLWNYLFRLSSY